MGAENPPLGGASIASGYTPAAFTGAKPRHPLKGSPQNWRFLWAEGYGACAGEAGRKETQMQKRKTEIVTARMTPKV